MPHDVGCAADVLMHDCDADRGTDDDSLTADPQGAQSDAIRRPAIACRAVWSEPREVMTGIVVTTMSSLRNE
jgi:hypothetical protein